MHYVISSGVEHVVEWSELRPVLVQLIGIIQECLCQWIVSAHDEEIPFRGDHVSQMVSDIEIVVDHGGLGHVIQNLKRINKFGSLFKIENTRMDCWLKAILQLKVSRKMFAKETVQLLLQIIS